MFQGDKDRKLGGRRAAQRRGGGGDGRDEVLEKARRERAQREKLRTCKVQAVTIQRWYRGRSAAAASRASERIDWDRKLSDFSKLQKTLLVRGIPFTPPVKFVLASLQQLLFFYRMQEDSGRLCLFCEVVLAACVLQPDPALNPVAHLLGVHNAGGAESEPGAGKGDRGDRDDAPARQALRCRLKRLLAACLAYGGKELNKGVAEGNFPLKVLLMLVGYPEYTGTSDDAPEPTMTAAAFQARSTISRRCMEVLVFELNLIRVIRGVMLGNDSERQAVASAGMTATPRPTPGRRGAMLSWWKMALHMLGSANTLCPPPRWRTDSSVTVGSWCRGSFVVEVLSAPLLPSRLGSDGINLLLKERRATFVCCLRDFRMVEEVRGSVGDGDGALSGASVKDGEIEAATSNTISAPVTVRIPPSPVSCCSSETFLLGNLSVLGTRFCMYDGGGVAVVGEDKSAVHSTAMPARELEEFLRAVTALLERKTIPDSLLTDRQAITWKSAGEDGGGESGNTSMIAMAVPQSVQDQVRLLVSDRWIRVASKRAMDGINEARLRRCTEAERLETKENLESSAASLAVASVRSQQAEANRGFVSKWAEKLRQSSKRWFRAESLSALAGYATTGAGTAAASPPVPPSGSGSGLIDSSAASRAAAAGRLGRDEGGGADGGSELGQGGHAEEQKQNSEDTPHDYDAEVVQALCDFLEVLLRRWGTGIHASNPVVQGLLNTLCFSLPCVARLWAFIFNECGGTVEDSCSPVERLCDSVPLESPTGGGLYSGIAVVCCLFGHMLVVLDDFELYESGRPLPLHHVRALVKGLKGPLFKFCWEVSYLLEEKRDSRGEAQPRQMPLSLPPDHFGAFFAGAVERLLRGLYVRSSRRALCRAEAWIAPQAESRKVVEEVKRLSPRAKGLLRRMPYCMSAVQRMKVFEFLVKADKAWHQPENARPWSIRVRRGHVLEDGLSALGSGERGSDMMKKRLSVQFTGAAGHEELGIDMGGLFKDFWTELSSLAFDVNYGLFRVTKERLMYPNPSSAMVHGAEHLQLFDFLGRILGKALYEGITVQPEFATFFLGFIQGDYNYLNLFHDLNGLDPELYRNLMFLKTYSGGDVEDLCLTFTVAEDAFGANKEIELIPGGSRRAVTSANRLEYVNRVAKYHLVDSLKPQAEAFVRGLWKVIDPLWLQMFSEPELQVLISGSNKTMDIDDLKRHTRYSGGFVGMDRTIRRFWSVMESMNETERAALLRFVTSCERPPPLGFESMHPPFCVHRVGIRTDDERLPTASTCFNTLKLPTYSSEKVMKAKLLTSIFSGTGFELS